MLKEEAQLPEASGKPPGMAPLAVAGEAGAGPAWTVSSTTPSWALVLLCFTLIVLDMGEPLALSDCAQESANSHDSKWMHPLS